MYSHPMTRSRTQEDDSFIANLRLGVGPRRAKVVQPTYD